MPESDTVWGLSAALSAIVIDPVLAPAAVGLKVTEIVAVPEWRNGSSTGISFSKVSRKLNAGNAKALFLPCLLT